MGRIGDRVWLDANGDGLQSPGESGVGAVTVRLRDGNNPQTVLGTTTTDAEGQYSFAGLRAGAYRVEFVRPTGASFTAQHQGDDRLDSDADPTTGLTAVINLGAGATNLDIEGDATAMFVARALNGLSVRVTRPASGLPVGGDLEYADEITLGRALVGRREVQT